MELKSRAKRRSHWQWFLRYRILKPHLLWRDIWWGFLHRTFKKFNIVKIKSLKPGYYDVDHRMLHANFQLLVEYVEKEKPFDHIDWEHDELHRHVAREIRALYYWWTEIYPNRKNPLDNLKDEDRPAPFECYSDLPGGGAVYGEKERRLEEKLYPKYRAALESSWELEKKWDQEEEDNLIRLMKIRQYLWT